MSANEGLIVGFLLVVVGLWLYTYRSVNRFKKKERSASDITMQGAWDYWMKSKDRLSDEDREIVELAEESLSAGAMESIRKELLELEDRSKKAENPLVPLRAAIMDAVDTSLLNKAITNLDDEDRKNVQDKLGKLYADEIFLWGYVAKGLMCRMLRWYSSRKYDDAAERDWFTSYLDIADHRAKKIVQLIRHWESDGTGTDGISRLISRTDEADALDQIRQKFLQAPKRTPIRRIESTGAEKPFDEWAW